MNAASFHGDMTDHNNLQKMVKALFAALIFATLVFADRPKLRFNKNGTFKVLQVRRLSACFSTR